jgi:DNA-directed RNA polymerase specialized sigma24 family protein
VEGMTGHRASGRMGTQNGPSFVVRCCRARVGGQKKTFASADDVAQEVRLVVLTTRPSYGTQGWPVHDFMYCIATHKVADAHRSAARNRAEPVPEMPDTQNLADGTDAQVMQVGLTERRTKLPDKQRDILVLRVVVALSAKETEKIIRHPVRFTEWVAEGLAARPDHRRDRPRRHTVAGSDRFGDDGSILICH